MKEELKSNGNKGMNVKQWQDRLEETFSFNGIVGGQLLKIVQCEQECGEYYVKTFRGQARLIDSFQGFLINTIEKSVDLVAKNGWPHNSEHYSATIIYFIMMIRRVRACECLLSNGYHMDGYALLRDMKERAIFLAALAHNLTTWEKLDGYGPDAPVPPPGKKITKEKQLLMKKNKKNEEHRLLGLMIRKQSGLDSKVLHELEKWEDLFDREIHGAKLSFFLELGGWATGKHDLSIGPRPGDETIAMYLNRICEIGWLITRLLPYMQTSINAFGDEWHAKWKILDDSFLFMQQDLSKLGKVIGIAFIELVNKKFYFKEPFIYFEPTGIG